MLILGLIKQLFAKVINYYCPSHTQNAPVELLSG